MSHEVDMTNGRENMAYIGERPWHGLGQELTPDAPLRTWMKEAGMSWNVIKAPVKFDTFDTKKDASVEHVFEDRFVLHRSDTKAPLAVCSGVYKPVHPGDVIAFFKDLIADEGFQMETAGCLFGGRKFWGLARTGKTVKVLGKDEVAPYLLMATSCDGSMATSVHQTSVRVVCNNTLRMSIGEDGKQAKIRVPHSAIFDAESVKKQLGVVKQTWQAFIENIETLARTKVDRDALIQIVADELKAEWTKPDGETMTQDECIAASKPLRRIVSLYDGEGLGSDLKTTKGTAWGMLNAVTQFIDHETGDPKLTDRSRAFERSHLLDRAVFKTKVANELLLLAA